MCVCIIWLDDERVPVLVRKSLSQLTEWEGERERIAGFLLQLIFFIWHFFQFLFHLYKTPDKKDKKLLAGIQCDWFWATEREKEGETPSSVWNVIKYVIFQKIFK